MSIVKATNVSKIYHLDGIDVNALLNIHIDIEAGELISIVGPSGSGKSTLMHLIGALDTPSEGDIFIDDKNISQMSEAQLAKIRNQKIGFVFQQFNLLPKMEAWRQVEIPLIYADWADQEKRKQKSVEMLERVGLGNRINNHPNQLSGGQQQRVAIARALINEPSLPLADEPTGALDTKTGKDIMKLFKELNKEGKTVVVVTHEHDIAKQTNRQIQIKDGQVIKQ